MNLCQNMTTLPDKSTVYFFSTWSIISNWVTYVFGPSTFSDEGLTPTKDGGTCLRRLSMFIKEVH